MRHVEVEALAPACPHCGRAAILATVGAIAGTSGDHASPDQPVWSCAPCDAYVGCHPASYAPLGMPARPALRRARRTLHNEVLDPLWRDAPRHPEFARDVRRDPFAAGIVVRKVRRRVYEWLADHLSLSEEEGHVGMFDERACEAATDALLGTTHEAIADWARPLEEARTLMPARARRHELELARGRAPAPDCPWCAGPATLIEADQDRYLPEVPVLAWACEACGLETPCLRGSTIPRGAMVDGARGRRRRALGGLVGGMADAAPLLPHYRRPGMSDLVVRRVRQVARMRIEDWLRVTVAGSPDRISRWEDRLFEDGRSRLAALDYDAIRAWAARHGWTSHRRMVDLLASAGVAGPLA